MKIKQGALFIGEIFSVVVLLVCVLAGVGFSESNTKEITLATTMKNAKSAQMLYHVLIYREAGKRLGININVKGYPSKRATYLGDTGEVDGQSGRVYAYNAKHPDLLRVEESLNSIKFSAFAYDQNIKLNGWESLKNKGFRVDYRRGTRLCTLRLPGVVKEGNISPVNEIKLSFRKMINGRSDVFIGVEIFILEELEKNEFKSSGIHKVGVMEEITVHGFLHKKHKDLVQRLSDVLTEMKKEGLMEKYQTFAMLCYDICRESKLHNDEIKCILK